MNQIPVPVKYVSKKINGALMWVPVYKKGEGPSSLPPKSPKKVELKVPPGYLKRYEEEHKGTKNGTKTVGVCRICKQKFDYIKSRRSMARKLCSVICAYQAQKNFDKDAREKKKTKAAVNSAKDTPPVPLHVQNTEKTTLCKGCGKPFQWKQQGRHASRKFCEAQCRLDYWAKKQADQWRVDRSGEYKCKNCDKGFSQKNLRGPVQKYCSAECRVSYNNRVVSGTKSFVERVAEHLPPTLPIQETKETLAPARPVAQPPSWETLVEEAGNMGITLDKEPARAQNFYIALLMARRAHHHEEWKKLLKSQNVRIRQLPETYMALKSVSGEGAIGAARALKTRMGM